VISTVHRMLTCHWSARRIQRYLDVDPSARLAPREVRRLEAHLAICEKCTELAQEHRRLNRALSRWSGRQLPTPDVVARMHAVVDRLVEPKDVAE
jgi:anti-sigma factor RsiW